MGQERNERNTAIRRLLDESLRTSMAGRSKGRLSAGAHTAPVRENTMTPEERKAAADRLRAMGVGSIYGRPQGPSKVTLTLSDETMNYLFLLSRQNACPEQDYHPTMESEAKFLIERGLLEMIVRGALPALPDDHPF